MGRVRCLVCVERLSGRKGVGATEAAGALAFSTRAVEDGSRRSSNVRWRAARASHHKHAGGSRVRKQEDQDEDIARRSDGETSLDHLPRSLVLPPARPRWTSAGIGSDSGAGLRAPCHEMAMTCRVFGRDRRRRRGRGRDDLLARVPPPPLAIPLRQRTSSHVHRPAHPRTISDTADDLSSL